MKYSAQNTQNIFHKIFEFILQNFDFWPIFTLIYLINLKFLLHNWKNLWKNILLLRGHLHNKISYSDHFETNLGYFWSCFNFQDFSLNYCRTKMDWISANSQQIFNFSAPKRIELNFKWQFLARTDVKDLSKTCSETLRACSFLDYLRNFPSIFLGKSPFWRSMWYVCLKHRVLLWERWFGWPPSKKFWSEQLISMF